MSKNKSGASLEMGMEGKKSDGRWKRGGEYGFVSSTCVRLCSCLLKQNLHTCARVDRVVWMRWCSCSWGGEVQFRWPLLAWNYVLAFDPNTQETSVPSVHAFNFDILNLVYLFKFRANYFFNAIKARYILAYINDKFLSHSAHAIRCNRQTRKIQFRRNKLKYMHTG